MRTASRGLDRLIVEFDRALKTLGGVASVAREMPGQELSEADLPETQRRHAAALMRVNHTGEICAQALYSGQALTARSDDTRRVLQRAGEEEAEHLAWTAARVESLGGRLSVLNPAFYAGSFVIGAVSGAAGDRWSLGFLAETERQVEAHLDGHLLSLPAADQKSRAVVERMKQDEARHASSATAHGAAGLPRPVKRIMKLAARVMTFTTYRL
ncbi:MAG: 2-polyprenyl-3-methyl-6-methoxy-1,4-benzoquinone monooxygenase [Betaproteobacteria bacterium]|nr:MAG: 2-polyprenyl-3-methyl-6-methoxy-1,4-benzoquinone monooxygenase [Betaproteobacteria bacterium]